MRRKLQGSTGDRDRDISLTKGLVESSIELIRKEFREVSAAGMPNPVVFLLDLLDEKGYPLAVCLAGEDSVENFITSVADGGIRLDHTPTLAKALPYEVAAMVAIEHLHGDEVVQRAPAGYFPLVAVSCGSSLGAFVPITSSLLAE
jgi:hypothetical protein